MNSSRVKDPELSARIEEAEIAWLRYVTPITEHYCREISRRDYRGKRLAGWMHILSMNFLGRFSNRVINLHPALPGQFAGTHAIERAFTAYQEGQIPHTGIMVHLVPDEGVDDGPVLASEIVPILPDDTLESLQTRIHAAEHRVLVDTIGRLIAAELAERSAH